jgi:hypothetical protein
MFIFFNFDEISISIDEQKRGGWLSLTQEADFAAFGHIKPHIINAINNRKDPLFDEYSYSSMTD